MKFHQSNPIPDNPSHKKLKLQFNEDSISSRRYSTPDISITIHNQSEIKSVTFIDGKEPIISFQQRLNMQNIYGVPPHITNQTPLQKKSIGTDRGRG